MSPASLLERLAPASDPPGARAATGAAWLRAHGLPHGRDEAWRYSPLDDILAVLRAAEPAGGATSVVDRSAVDELAGVHGGPVVVLVNGVLDPALSDLDPRCRGLWLGGADGLRPRRAPGAPAPDDEPADGFHALNWVAGRDVAAVLVEPDVHVDRPVHVVHLSAPGGGITATHPRTVVRVGERSSVRVVESFVGLDGRPFTNASTRIVAGAGASVAYVREQAEVPGAVHVGRVGIDQAEGSVVRATSIMTGGDIARLALDVRLRGAGARSELDGLCLPTRRQRHDHAVTVDHLAPATTSGQRFTGIVDGRGRGSFSGHVIVRPGAAGADARQSNRNLLLSPTAEADTRPWLEIFTDDVRCTHGATVGRLDADALFYLRSRGIPLAESRAMLVRAFGAEIIDGIAPVSLRDRAEAAFDAFAGQSC